MRNFALLALFIASVGLAIAFGLSLREMNRTEDHGVQQRIRNRLRFLGLAALAMMLIGQVILRSA